MFTFDDYKKIFKIKIVKTIIILGVVFSLLGTVFSIYGWVKLPEYDSNEYFLFSTVKTHSVLGKESCHNSNQVKKRLNSIIETSELLVVFTEYPSFNKNTYDIAVIIQDMSKEMIDRYAAGNPSKIYCELKFDNIIEATTKIMKILGDRRPTNGII